LAETFGEKCSDCGWSKVHPKTGKVPVQVDHIDGNPSNHSPQNLRLLCPNCHSLTSTYGALNKGNGRKERYAS
jgi:5-methylcytosine-specific restriction endonuclease McrA